MRVVDIALFSLVYVFCIFTNLFVFRYEPQFREVYYIFAFLALLVLILHLLYVYGFPRAAQVFRANRLFFLYATSVLVVQLFFHRLDAALYVRLMAYMATGFVAYIVLAELLSSNPDLLNRWLGINAYACGLLAIFAILANIGFDEIWGLPLSKKFGKYQVFGIQATGGILNKPNNLGAQMLIGVGCSLYLFSKKKSLTNTTLLGLCMTGLILSLGRGPWLGATVGFIYLFFLKKNLSNKAIFFVVLPMFTILILSLLYRYMQEVELAVALLRLRTGISGREVLWPFALSLIAKSPFTGYGFLSASDLKYEYGSSLVLRYAPDSSFHNNFIDVAAQSGVVVTLLYLALFIVPISRLLASDLDQQLKRTLLFITISMFVAANFVNYNIGGLRATSLSLSVFLGIANLSRLPVNRRSSIPVRSHKFGLQRNLRRNVVE